MFCKYILILQYITPTHCLPPLLFVTVEGRQRFVWPYDVSYQPSSKTRIWQQLQLILMQMLTQFCQKVYLISFALSFFFFMHVDYIFCFF